MALQRAGRLREAAAALLLCAHFGYGDLPVLKLLHSVSQICVHLYVLLYCTCIIIFLHCTSINGLSNNTFFNVYNYYV